MTSINADRSREAFDKVRKMIEVIRPPVKVLLVEDDAKDAELLLRTMPTSRANVTVSTTGIEAINRIENCDYDLCLLDLKLPDMPGSEVIRWAKEHGRKVPFVVLTGMDVESPLIKQALIEGADAVVHKPLSTDNMNMIFGSL